MEKKYQVFISSTFKDLEEERRAVYDALLDAECIPAGMECFYAEDAEQFNVIKRVIDLCDFYLLIIGGRYGSIDKKTRKSYTEMEYEYAVEKGIPVLVFPIKNVESLPLDKKESDGFLMNALNEFKSRAIESRMSSFWGNIEELKYNVLKSISKAKEKYNRPGWIRGNENYSYGAIDDVLKENKELKGKIEELNNNSNNEDYDFLNKKIKIQFTEAYNYDCPKRIEEEITYREIFKSISGKLISMTKLDNFLDAINDLCSKDGLYYTSEKIQNTIKATFVAHDILKCETIQSNDYPLEMIGLTDKGKKLLGLLFKEPK